MVFYLFDYIVEEFRSKEKKKNNNNPARDNEVYEGYPKGM